MCDLSKKSRRLLIEMIQREIKRLAVDANLFEIYTLDTSNTRGAARRRRELCAVLKELENDELLEKVR